MVARIGSKVRIPITVVDAGRGRRRLDTLATEEPLEIRLRTGDERRTIAITMRTPGADFELAAGFLFGERVIEHKQAIASISYCVDPEIDADQRYNIVNVDLRAAELPPLTTLDRHFFTSSACGVCGKASLDALELGGIRRLHGGLTVSAEQLTALPERLRQAQGLFDETGGLHAAALFDEGGDLLCVREDVGRHNAVDKVIGWALMQNRLPLSGSILMVSGRTSYEILQKSTVAGIPIVAAVSAPSSLAVELARRFGVTLIGFLRGDRFNIYAGRDRVLDISEG